MRYAILAVLLVIAVLRLFQVLEVENPADLPPFAHEDPPVAAANDEAALPAPPQKALSHEIRTTLRTSPSHPPATRPMSPPGR